MTKATECGRAIEALSRIGVSRDGLGETKDDAGLIRFVAPGVESSELRAFVGVSRLLRLMDGVLTGTQTGEGFVEKFSESWLSLAGESVDVLQTVFGELEEFYEEIQLFCASGRHLQEEGALFGLPRLQEITIAAYDSIRRQWIQSLTEVGGAHPNP